jgi:hypothetical protein
MGFLKRLDASLFRVELPKNPLGYNPYQAVASQALTGRGDLSLSKYFQNSIHTMKK